jgi:Lysophospholipase L1 and related esterases
MMKTRACFPLVLLLLVSTAVTAQQPPFYNEIQAYKKQDSLQFPPKNAILFVGSSSFNFWKDVQDYFPNHTIINRGFGGSTLKDVIYYAPEIIYPYAPKQVVIYCGENDLGQGATPDTVFNRFTTLFGMIRKRFKNIPIVYVSIKPSPSRQHLMPQMVEANTMIREFLAKQKRTAFVDVYSKMIDENNQPRKEIFTNDNLHINAKGYELWKGLIEPHLVK